MIGIDSNVLLRFVLNDDKSQANLARRLMHQAVQTEGLLLNAVVMLESVWTLERRFGIARHSARAQLFDITQIDNIHTDHRISAESVAKWWRSDHRDIWDVAIAAINRSAGCEATYTFDKRAARDVSGMKLLT